MTKRPKEHVEASGPVVSLESRLAGHHAVKGTVSPNFSQALRSPESFASFADALARFERARASTNSDPETPQVRVASLAAMRAPKGDHAALTRVPSDATPGTRHVAAVQAFPGRRGGKPPETE